MKLKLLLSLSAALSLFGATAHAQELPKIDASVSYSYLRANPATSGLADSISTGAALRRLTTSGTG